jgi:hypothetical protein
MFSEMLSADIRLTIHEYFLTIPEIGEPLGISSATEDGSSA